jgi:hypothetical protein
MTATNKRINNNSKSSQAMLIVKMLFCFPGLFLVIQNDTMPPVSVRMTYFSLSAQLSELSTHTANPTFTGSRDQTADI